jgi:hypothetical protein
MLVPDVLRVVQATRVITASEDDSSPIIMVWDLRNARAPEKVCLSFHLCPPVDDVNSYLDIDWP